MNVVEKAARIILDAWRARAAIDALPDNCRPQDLEAGYRIQDALEAVRAAARSALLQR